MSNHKKPFYRYRLTSEGARSGETYTAVGGTRSAAAKLIGRHMRKKLAAGHTIYAGSGTSSEVAIGYDREPYNSSMKHQRHIPRELVATPTGKKGRRIVRPAPPMLNPDYLPPPSGGSSAPKRRKSGGKRKAASSAKRPSFW